MARANESLIKALRKAADLIEKNTDYQWGHMGACNCGHLAQVITGYSKAYIHQTALANGVGDWNEQLRDFCPTTRKPFDDIVAAMLDLGVSVEDLSRLERLSDARVLARLPFDTTLQHNVREDVVLYLTLWADLLEEEFEEHKKRLSKFKQMDFNILVTL